MDVKAAEYRARVACRIYLALFHAGDRGVIIAYDDMLDFTMAVPRDHATVQHVLKRLCEDGAIHQNDSSRPHQHVLLDGARNRMAHRLGADLQPYHERIEHDLLRFAAREPVPGGNWLDYEVRIRKGELEREAL